MKFFISVPSVGTQPFVLLTSVFSMIAKSHTLTTKTWGPQLAEKQLLACLDTWRHFLLHGLFVHLFHQFIPV